MDKQIPKPLIAIVAVIQAICLTFLYLSVEHKYWPATQPIWLYSLGALCFSFPILTYLGVTSNNQKRFLSYALGFATLLALCGAYVGFQSEPQEYVRNGGLVAIFCFTGLIASFKALMYFQQLANREPITYPNLFLSSWRNFLIFGECWLFTLIFLGILHLGAALFAVLDILFFEELLEEAWFVIPVLNLAFAFAAVLFRSISNTVDTIRTILKTLLKFLLPALAIVSLGFMFTLPFTGLDKLWDTGSGTLLVMWLLALLLFFVNAVYQADLDEKPYHSVVHKIILLSVALAPVYSLIALYGLYLRIEQYGFTVSRLWGLVVWFVLTAFAFGYCISIIKKRDQWLTWLSKVNIGMSVVVLAITILVNTPLLNFQQISVSSQLNRLSSGKISLDDFNAHYLLWDLGRAGYLALEQLKQEYADNEAFVREIERLIASRNNRDAPVDESEQLTQAKFTESALFYPDQSLFGESLITAVYEQAKKNEWNFIDSKNYYFFAVDLNQDDSPEYIVVQESNNWTSGYLWRYHEDKWQQDHVNIYNPDGDNFLKTAIEEQNIAVKKPKWSSLQVGSILISIDEKRND
ncbi:DUF4153 domain-containing protein [Thalassotalea agarivorans]|uniref:DUF4153 domain-containing protein n=1 Tax=Thalassotalea agarivorans TaxID=349064 RepID=A0A1I0GV55_THASX|nr:DUF4153 domain-containing protein [Thalassotalea agarivorans]SET75257.1 protein of unknown function [Thalassotalea agarivorans]